MELNQEQMFFKTYKYSMNLLFVFLLLIINEILCIDFADISSFIDGERYQPSVNNIHYCQWVFYENSRVTNEILQIDLISDMRRITLNKGRQVNNPLFTDWGFDMNFYNDCGEMRFCNAYQANNSTLSMFSLKAFQELIISNDDMVLNNQIILNQNTIQNFPSKNSWNYICNSYIFDNKLISNFETSLISNNSSYFYKHILTRINDEKNQRDFKKERVLVYFKNTDYLIRGNVFKIFIDLNIDLYQQHLFASMFSRELMIKFPNYIVKNYFNLTKSTYIKDFYNKNNNYLINNNGKQTEKNWASTFENFLISNNNTNFYFKDFYFPNIFQYIDYEYVYESDFVLRQDIPRNYLDRNILLNLTNYLTALRFSLDDFFDKINIGDFDYLKNFFDITTNEKDDFYLKMLNQNSYFVLANDIPQLEYLITSSISPGFVDSSETDCKNKNNLIYLTKLKNIEKISQLDLFSYNFVCVIIKDKFGKTVFQDLRANAFKNYSPNKILKISSSKFNLQSTTRFDSSLGTTTPYALLENLNINTKGGFDNLNTLANCFWFNMNYDVLNKIPEKQQNRRNSMITKNPTLLEIEYAFYPFYYVTNSPRNLTSNIKFNPIKTNSVNDQDTLFEINIKTTDYTDAKVSYLPFSLNYNKKYSKIKYNNGWNHICQFTSAEVKQTLDQVKNFNVTTRHLMFDFYLNDLKYSTIRFDITKFTESFLDSMIYFDYRIKSIYQNLYLSNYRFNIIAPSILNRVFSKTFNTTEASFDINYLFNAMRFSNLEPKYDSQIFEEDIIKSLTKSIIDFNFEGINNDSFHLGYTKENNAILNYFESKSFNTNIDSNFSFPNGFLINEFINFNSRAKFVNVFAKGYPYFKYTINEIVIIIKLDVDFVLKAFKKDLNQLGLNRHERDYFLIKINDASRILSFNDAFYEQEFYQENLYTRQLLEINVIFNKIKDVDVIYSYNYSKNFKFYFVSRTGSHYNHIYDEGDLQLKGNYKFSKFNYDFENIEDFSRNFVDSEPRCKIENFFSISYLPNYKNSFVEYPINFNPKLIETKLVTTIFDKENKNAVKPFNLMTFSINEITTKIKENSFIDFNYFKSDNAPVTIPFDFSGKIQKEGTWNINSQKVPSSIEINGLLPLVYNPELNKVNLQYYTNEILFNLAMIIRYHDYYFDENIINDGLEMNFISRFFKDELSIGIYKNMIDDKRLIYKDENQRYSFMANSNIITVKNIKNSFTKNYKTVYFTIYLNNPGIIVSKRLKFIDNLESLNKEEKRNYNLKITLVNSYKMYQTYKIELEENIVIGGSQEQDIYENENISFLINFSPNLILLKRENINYSSKTNYVGNEMKIKIYIEKIKFKNYRWNSKVVSSLDSDLSPAFNVEYIFSVHSMLQEIIFSKKEFYNLIQNQTKYMLDNYLNENKITSFQLSLLKISNISKIISEFEIKEYKENVFGLVFKNVPEALLNIEVFKLNIDISNTIKGYFGNSYGINPNFYFSPSSRSIELLTTCNKEFPFLWKKSNLRFIENPPQIMELSVFLYKMTLFLNPICFSELEYIRINNGFSLSDKEEENFYFSSYVKTIFFSRLFKNLFIEHKYKLETAKRLYSWKTESISIRSYLNTNESLPTKLPKILDNTNIIKISNILSSAFFDTFVFIVGSVFNDSYLRINIEYNTIKEDEIISLRHIGECNVVGYSSEDNGKNFYSTYKGCFETYLEKEKLKKNINIVSLYYQNISYYSFRVYSYIIKKIILSLDLVDHAGEEIFRNNNLNSTYILNIFDSNSDVRNFLMGRNLELIRKIQCNKKIFYQQFNQFSKNSTLKNSNYTTEVYNIQNDQILYLNRLETTTPIDRILSLGYKTTFKFMEKANYTFYNLINQTIYGMVTCEICFLNYYCEKINSPKVDIFYFIPPVYPEINNNSSIKNDTNGDNINNNSTVNNTNIKNNTTKNNDTLINNNTNTGTNTTDNNNTTKNNDTLINNNTNTGTNKTDNNNTNINNNTTSNTNNNTNSNYTTNNNTVNDNHNTSDTNISKDNQTVIIKNTSIFEINNNNVNLQISTNPLKNNTQEIKAFSNLTAEEKIKKIENITQKLDIFESITTDGGNNKPNPIDGNKDNKPSPNNLIMNLTHSDKIDILQDTITLNAFISNTNCSNFANSNEKQDCESKIKDTQKKIVSTMSVLLNCSEIFKIVFGSENPEKNFILSTLSLFYSTSNFNTFTNSSLIKVNDIIECLIGESSKIINKISQNNTNTTQNENIKNDFMNIISTTTSNMINIVKKTSKNELNNTANYDDFKNGSLIINSNTIQVKSVIEQNAVNLMRLEMNKALNSPNISSFNGTNSTNSTTNKKDPDNFSLRTKNIIFFAQKINLNELVPMKNQSNDNFDNNTNSGKSNLRRLDSSYSDKEISFDPLANQHQVSQKKGKLIRYLSSNNQYEIVKVDDFDMNIRIHIPIDYLKNEYNKNISSYGLILYNKYPLLSPENKNFSEKIISLRMFDKDLNKIEISNLTTPIDIFIKKPFKGFDNCIFFDTHSSFWGVKGCKSIDLGDTMLCSCTHLTDFSLSKFNPTLLLRDMVNIITDAWIIKDLKTFKNLKFDNAQVIFIYVLITVIYGFGLIFALRYDRKDPNDNYIYEVNRISYCCSKKETLENINEIKEITEKAEEERKIRALKYLESRLETLNLNQKILNTFGVNIQLDKKEIIESSKKADELIEDEENKTRNRKTFREVFSGKYFKKSQDKNSNVLAKSEEQEKGNEIEVKEKSDFLNNKIANEKKKSIMIKDIEMQTIKAPGSSIFEEVNEEKEGDLDYESNCEEILENNVIAKEIKNDEEKEKSQLKNNSFKNKIFSFNKVEEKEKEKNGDEICNENKDESDRRLRLNNIKSTGFLNNLKKSKKRSKKTSFDNQENSINSNNLVSEEVKNETSKKQSLILNDSEKQDQKLNLIQNECGADENENVKNNINDPEKKENERKTKLETLSKSPFSKILFEGLKIKLQDKLVNHDEFIFKMYKQNENQEIKKDILKFFVIKPSSSKKTKFIQKFKNQIDKKIKNKNDNNSNSNNALEKSNDLQKNILVSTTEDIKFENLNNKETKIDCLCLDTTDNTGNSSLLTKDETKFDQSRLSNIENQSEVENENDEEFSISKIELKNKLLFKYLNLVKFFFLNEYRLICIFVSQFNTFTKTSFLSIIIFKIYCALGVCAILSPTMDNEQKSTKGFTYTNRDLAVALLTIFIVEIPFMAVESHLSKRKVLTNWSAERKLREKEICVRNIRITYFILILVSIFGLINSTWISLKQIEIGRGVQFYRQFGLALIMDFFVYEVLILITKSIIFFLIIKDEDNNNLPCWKNFLITMIAAMPWAFTMFG